MKDSPKKASSCSLETEEDDAEGESVGHQEISLGDDEDEADQNKTNDGKYADIKFKEPKTLQVHILIGVEDLENAGRDIHKRGRECVDNEDPSRYQVWTDVELTGVGTDTKSCGECAVEESKICYFWISKSMKDSGHLINKNVGNYWSQEAFYENQDDDWFHIGAVKTFRFTNNIQTKCEGS